MIERVQHRAETKFMEGYQNFNDEERLRKTGLISLEKHRVRGGLVQAFKMIRGYDKKDSNKFFEISREGKTRGHSMKLIKKRSNTDLRKHFFSPGDESMESPTTRCD